MTPFLQLILALSVIILAAKAGGYLAFKLGQPSVLGELLVGILIGPSAFDLLHQAYLSSTHLAETVHELAEIGVLLLMFLAGLELHLQDIPKTGKVALLAGTLGVVLPLALGAGLGLGYKLSVEAAIFLGLILAATSVSISAQTLMELKVLRSRVGIGLLGAAVFDDVLVVVGLSIFLALGSDSQGWGNVLIILVEMAAFILLSSVFGYFLLPRLSQRVSRLQISQGLIAFTFVALLGYGWLSEEFGNMAAITGAFMAGLWLSRSQVKDRIESGISVLAYAVFVPVFFVNVGLTADIRVIFSDNFLFFVILSILAIVSKVVGAGGGAKLSGYTTRESLQLGVGMVSRGEVGLIVASVGVQQELIDPATFAAIVGVVILTTLLTPIALRALFPKPAQPKTPAQINKEAVA